MYGCESWTVKKAEHRRIDAFELWCWRRLLRVPWTARRSAWLFIGRTDAKAEAPMLWPPDGKSWLIRKDSNVGKIPQRREYQTTWPASWETYMQVRKQQLELDMEQQAGSKIGKGVCQGCILSPCLFNFYAEYIMWNSRVDISQAGIKIAGRNINNLRYADDTTLMAESEEELKSLLMKVKVESENVGLKLTFRKRRSWHLVPSLHGK